MRQFSAETAWRFVGATKGGSCSPALPTAKPSKRGGRALRGREAVPRVGEEGASAVASAPGLEKA